MDAVILDVDGTLCDVRGVRATWSADQWHLDAAACPPVASVVSAACSAHDSGLVLLIVTARDRRYARLTVQWLARHLPVPYAGLYMRSAGDGRGHGVVKRELLELIREDGYRVVRAYEDNPAVVRVWESERIPTTVVRGFC